MIDDMEQSFPGNKRIIDLTCSELITLLRQYVVAELLPKLEPVPPLEEGKVHPATGLPEGPEDEVNSDRAREILRTKAYPISVPYLDKLRKKPHWDMTGRNIGGSGLPYKLIGRRALYKVKDLLTFRENPQAFLK